LNRVCLTIPKNSHVGIIGDSGIGKSTLVELIAGLLTPDEGAIVVDEWDIKHCLPDWQKRISLVGQTPIMVEGSVLENVAFGVEEAKADPSHAMKCLATVGLDTYIASLEGGLSASISDRGTNLSGGQRQRLSIARALYASPELLILDEGTSALDSESERIVLKSIRNISNMTIISIAHRQSALQYCDRVIRLHNAGIDEVRLP
jgi:ABC-type bacteriocin/lantibiotic exporter with double-glycine peptidase domain